MGKISAKCHKADGSRSSFYVINRRKGFKTFDSKRTAELARCYQTILADQGYAPKVHSEVGRITVNDRDNKPVLSDWGYVVEKVTTFGCKYSAGGCECERCCAANDDYMDTILEVCDEVEQECGVRVGDRHLGNFGLKNGRILVIDTGVETFQEY